MPGSGADIGVTPFVRSPRLAVQIAVSNAYSFVRAMFVTENGIKRLRQAFADGRLLCKPWARFDAPARCEEFCGNRQSQTLGLRSRTEQDKACSLPGNESVGLLFQF